MVSFSCEVCNETLVKKKLNGHFRACPQAYFTCIDCNTTFDDGAYNAHTQCISEAEKYQKALYKPKKKQEQVTEKKSIEQAAAKVSKKQESKNKDTGSKPQILVPGETKNAYKVIKELSKAKKLDKKDLLKQLKVKMNDSGEYVLEL